jgi:hypothetical protein
LFRYFGLSSRLWGVPTGVFLSLSMRLLRW